jgi:tRNA(Ile)-lysidine synthase
MTSPHHPRHTKGTKKDDDAVTSLANGLQKRLYDLVPSLAKVDPPSLVVAVSGGTDSLALLHLLAQLDNVRLEVAHLNHQLRADADADAAFVKYQAEKLDVNYHEHTVDVARVAQTQGWNLEQAARTVRYQFLHKVAKQTGAQAIVTAHTQNDQAETVLMQLLRGAALLHGMPAVRGLVVRPLLSVSRAQLKAVLVNLEQQPREDVSNADTSRLRAWCRHVLMPLLATRNPNIIHQLANLAGVQRAHKDHFDSLSAPVLSSVQGAHLTLNVPDLHGYDLASQRHLVAALLNHADIAPEFEHVETIVNKLAELPQQTVTLPWQHSLPGAAQVHLVYDTLAIIKQPLTAPGWLPVHGLSAEAVVGLLEHHHIPISPPLNLEALTSLAPLSLRTRQAGDRLHLTHGHKKLSDVLIDCKVPSYTRDSLILISREDTHQHEVLWVQGVRADARVAMPQQPPPEVVWMQAALAEARRAGEVGEVPVGAVVVYENQIIATAGNRTERDNDPSAHAELLALKQASQSLQSWRLSNCILVITLEPCLMCLGASLQAHVGSIIYGARNPREGALGGVSNVLTKNWKRHPKIRGGVLAAEAAELLQTFFKSQR